MSSSMLRGVRRGLGLLATGAIMAGMASGGVAQTPPGAVVQPLTRDNGAELRGYLTTLANNPQSLDALIGAGRAALRMGDADAALTFFGRADEVSPRNARVKAGMASTLVQLGQPDAALSLFTEAVALGAPVAEIQADRGLAYDLSGDPRRAQQDYVAALRRRDDSEVRRHLALSLAISGHRDAALRTIDAQLRANARGAWRTQAFILALTGDAAGADRIANAQMPGAGQQMAPFFARLHALSPAQKALAVHLGRFPSNGSAPVQTARVDTSPDPAALAFVGVPARTHVQTAAASRTRGQDEGRRSNSARRRDQPDPSDRFGLRERRRAERQSEVAPPVERRTVAEVDTRWAGPQPPAGSEPAPQPTNPVQPPPPAASSPIQSVQPAVSLPPPPASTMQTNPPETAQPQEPAITSVPIPASVPEQTVAPASTGVAATGSVSPEPAPLQTVPAPTPVETAPALASRPAATAESSLADIAALVRTLPDESSAGTEAPTPAPSRAAQPTRTASRTAESRTGTTRTAERSTRPPAQPANPSRHWVQIAGGIDRASLPREFARLRSKAPEQLGRRTAYAAPLRTTSRLLVGPFATTREAQDFVNQLARHDIQALAWTSAAGQEIERIAAR